MAEAFRLKLPADLVKDSDWFEHPDPEVGRLLFDSCSDDTLNGVIAVQAGEPMPYDDGILGRLYVLPADQKLKVYDGPAEAG